MKLLAVIAAMLLVVLVLSSSWATVTTYDGSVDPTTVGWTVWEGVIQGSALVEGDGTTSWFLNDSSVAKTKLTLTGVGNMDLSVGATVEGRIKCTALSGATPLNLGLQGYDGSNEVGHWVTVAPDRLLWNKKDTAMPEGYAGDFTGYHVIRLCYKRMNLAIRGTQPDTWAVYVDGSTTPILISHGNPAGKGWSGPTWGSGNTGDTQDIYFDWVTYDDGGAYPPGMTGAVDFVNMDPDGTSAPDGSSFTISWTTDVPTTGTVYYSADPDISFSLSASDSVTDTTHNVTVTGTTPGVTYHYYVVSDDGSGNKAISLPSDITVENPFFIATGPDASAAPDGLSATITWETNEAAVSSEVHYGLDSSCPDVVVELGTGLTSHSVTVPTLPEKPFYYFYVKSTHSSWPAAQSAVGTFDTYVIDLEQIDNPGFETGVLAPWVKFGSFDGIYNMFDYAVQPIDAKWAGSVASYGTGKSMAGIYQIVGTVPGKYYEPKVYIWTRRQSNDPTHPSQPLDVACRIGLDPTGGTDETSPNIFWGPWMESDDSSTDGETGGSGGPWKQISTAAKATGTTATIFLQQLHKWGLVWNIDGFDNASLETWTKGDPMNHIGKAKAMMPEGYPVSFTSKIVTNVWQVQEIDSDTLRTYLDIQEADCSAGIKVDATNAGLATPPVVGDLTDVKGNLETIRGEAQLTADRLSVVGHPDPMELPKPIDVVGKDVASGSLGVQPALPGCSGLSNAGLRVRTAGRITGIGLAPDGYFIYIDDGSGVANDSQTAILQSVKGIKAYVLQSFFMSLDYVAVTGNAGVEYDEVTQTFYPVIRAYTENEVQTFPEQ